MKKQEIKIKEDSKVFKDNKTNARTLAIPLRINGTSSILMISKLKDEDWQPSKEIKSIIINYK